MAAAPVRAPAKTRRTQAKPRSASKRGSVQGAATARKPRPTAATARSAAKARPRSRASSARTARRPVTTGGVVALPVAAVGRTAHAVSGLADSGLVHGLARSRAWIVLLGVLLAGIVAVNVIGLSLSASNSRVAAKIGELQQANGVLSGRIADRTSTAGIQKEANALGLHVPPPDDVHYLHSGGKDAAVAAKRLAAGEIGSSLPADEAEEAAAAAVTSDPAAAAVVVTPTVDPVAGATVDPATGAIVDPATGAPVDPATGAPTAATATTTDAVP